MPSTESTRFEVAVYVEPEYVDKFRELIDINNDDSLWLDIEKAIGRRLAGLERMKAGYLGGEHYDYGGGVAEVYMEDES